MWLSIPSNYSEATRKEEFWVFSFEYSDNWPSFKDIDVINHTYTNDKWG